MADLKHGSNPLFLREEELRQGLELLALVHRDFAAAADADLAEAGLGRAHHRALSALARTPSLKVADLLATLGVTKQSAARVLAELKTRGLVVQRRGRGDGRTRSLALTEDGAAIEARLSQQQRLRLARAYSQAGAEAVEGFRAVLALLVDPEDRRRLAVGQTESPRPEARPAVWPKGPLLQR